MSHLQLLSEHVSGWEVRALWKLVLLVAFLRLVGRGLVAARMICVEARLLRSFVRDRRQVHDQTRKRAIYRGHGVPPVAASVFGVMRRVPAGA